MLWLLRASARTPAAVVHVAPRNPPRRTTVQESLRNVQRFFRRHERIGPLGPHQILQPPGYVVILDEQSHQYRVVPVDARAHVGSGIRLWLGDATGHWEGNTLIVETTNFNDKTWWDQAATFHSEAQRTVERFTVVDANTINYDLTIEDKNILTEPLRGLSTTFQRAQKGEELLEEECLEGNRLENYGFKGHDSQR